MKTITQASPDLRRVVYKAILSAQSAARAQQLLSEFAELTADHITKQEIKIVSQAAYAASAHAWIAMLAMASNSFDVAQNAAQAAGEVEQTIISFAKTTLLLDPSMANQKKTDSFLPSEQELFDLWSEFCRSLPSGFPVPDSFNS